MDRGLRRKEKGEKFEKKMGERRGESKVDGKGCERKKTIKKLKLYKERKKMEGTKYERRQKI